MVMPDTPSPRPKTELTLGFTAELASAPLVVAAELGLWSRRGLSVRLHRELGGAGLRDRLLTGQLQAAAVPCGLPLALMAETDPCPEPPPLTVGMILSRGGQTLVLSESLWPSDQPDIGAPGHPMRPGRRRVMTLGLTSRHSAQEALIRHWMRTVGLTEDHLHLAVIPPAQLNTHLRCGNIDGFCAGPLASAEALMGGHGRMALSNAPSNAPSNPPCYRVPDPPPPDTVLALASGRAPRSPGRACEWVGELLAGLAEACRYCDDPSHRPRIAEWLSRRHYLHAPIERILLAWNPPTRQEPSSEPGPAPSLVFHREPPPDPHAPDPMSERWILENTLRADERVRLSAAVLESVFRREHSGPPPGKPESLTAPKDRLPEAPGTTSGPAGEPWGSPRRRGLSGRDPKTLPAAPPSTPPHRAGSLSSG
jgi:ABC-type nitrate/sulfonate/bicarbonate transport system substrate-binding protein